MFDIHPKNPLRPPDWRWKRADVVVEGGTISRSVDDNMVHRLVRFRNRQNRTVNAGASSELVLISTYPDLYIANKLRHENDYLNMRMELEARVLADESQDDLATRFGVCVDAIKAYENVFFDVRERLRSKSYILHMIIGSTAVKGLTASDIGTLWKLHGYYSGPQVLDMIVYGFQDRDSLIAMSDNEALDSVIATRMRQKAAIATATMPINTLTQQVIWDSWQQLRKHDRESQQSGAQQNTYLANVAALLRLEPFSVGQRVSTLTAKPASVAAVYESGHYELRGDELATVGTGSELPYAEMFTQGSTENGDS